MEAADHVLRALARRVHEPDDAQEPAAALDEHRRATIGFELAVALQESLWRGRAAVQREQVGLADGDGLAAERGADAVAGDALQPLRRGCARHPVFEVADDGARERVLAEALDGDDGLDQLGLGRAVGGHHVGHTRLALGQRARLVERDGAQPTEGFERPAAP